MYRTYVGIPAQMTDANFRRLFRDFSTLNTRKTWPVMLPFMAYWFVFVSKTWCSKSWLKRSLHTAVVSLTPPCRPDLIKPVSNVRPSARPYARPSTKRLFNFNEIWHVGRGRRVMHDGAQYDPIQGQGHKLPESRKFGHFQRLSPPPFIMGAGKWPRILTLGAIPKAYRGHFFLNFCPSFCVKWLLSWQ